MDDTTEAALNSVLEHDEESFEELCQNLSVLSPRETNFSHGSDLCCFCSLISWEMAGSPFLPFSLPAIPHSQNVPCCLTQYMPQNT